MAEVLDAYMYENGQFNDNQADQYEQRGPEDRPIYVKQTNRALTGKLTEKVLENFVRAFEITEPDARELWSIWHGEKHSLVVVGTLERRADLPAHGHETVSVDEDHHIGANGFPARHEVRQTIRAVGAELAGFPYFFDTNAVDVRLVSGGTQGEMTRHSEHLWRVMFTFGKPVALGATKFFHYTQNFNYTEPPDPDYRRCIYNRYNGWNVRVHFHPDRLPGTVWWAEWENDRPDSPIKYREPVELDDGLAAHRSLLSIERAVAGFVWDW
ncbi:hypothetical protein [Actinosynnema sp. NPDC020468]|uniref:hypothetical protein n=1 Tax=Actinosynnema sp. NPDC020468 TaxID=3154488 RepID=UPI0033FD771F